MTRYPGYMTTLLAVDYDPFSLTAPLFQEWIEKGLVGEDYRQIL